MWLGTAQFQLYLACVIGMSRALETCVESMTTAMLPETAPNGKQMHPCLRAWYAKENVIYPLPWRHGFSVGRPLGFGIGTRSKI